MKKFMISLAVASIAMFSYAQETVSEVVVPTVKNSVVTNSFGSNWFVSVNGGVNLYNGVVTNGESPFKHISPALNIYAGKWHTPGFGWRVGYNGLNVQCFEAAPHKTFVNFHFDALFNIRNLIWGYKEAPRFDVIPYLGVGWAGRKGYADDDLHGGVSANYGIIASYNFAKRWAFNVELGGLFLRNGFNGVSGSSGHDMMWSATAGFTFKLGKTGWSEAADVPAILALHAAAIDELNAQMNAVKAENNKTKKALTTAQNDLAAANNEIKRLADEPKFVNAKQSVFFAFGSAKIDSKKEEMNIAAFAEAAAAAGAKVRVTGYADTIGAEDYNLKLSQERADAVAAILKSKGVEVEAVGAGETNELSNKYLNRRAIMEIVK